MILENNIDEISYRIVSVRASYVFFWRRKWQPTPVLLPGYVFTRVCAWKSNYYNFSNMLENTTVNTLQTP